MGKIPKPRKSGQTGGSIHNKKNRATHAAARVTQKAGKSSCLSIIIVAVIIFTGAGLSVAALIV